MPIPTETEIQDQIAKTIRVYEHIDRFGNGVISPNFTTLQAAVQAALKGDYSDLVSSSLEVPRSRLAGALTGDGVGSLTPLLAEYGQTLDVAPQDPDGVVTEIYNHFIAAGLRVQSRRFTFVDPVAAGSNVGDGRIVRHNLDENGLPIENQTPDAKTALCVADQNTGTAIGEEQFLIRGAAPGRDAVSPGGSGASLTLQGLSANNARTLSNPSFTSPLGTTIPGWTMYGGTVIGSFSLDLVNFYRSDLSDAGVPASLKITATSKIKQTILGDNLTVDPTKPWYLQVAWNRAVGAATGTLVIKMGSKTTTVAVAAQAGWNLATVGPFWYKNFAVNSMEINIEWTRVAGDILVDDVLFVPGTAFDGSWYWVIGARTLFLRNDAFSWTDSALESVIQKWLWRWLGRYLPAALVAPASAPTAALAGVGAGSVDNGTHSYKVTFVDGLGNESGPSSASNIVTVVNNLVDGKVALTLIPTGPAGTTKRKLYRTVAGNAPPWKFLDTIADNVTTVYTDNTADAGLGASAPTGITWFDPA